MEIKLEDNVVHVLDKLDPSTRIAVTLDIENDLKKEADKKLNENQILQEVDGDNE